jgi:hypothetical protein
MSKPVVSAAVMAHPSRVEAARDVAARLAPLPVRLALDPEPDGPPSSMRAARLAFAAAAHGASHHLVVQDDVAVPPNFAVSATQAIARHPDAAVSLFVEWGSRTATLVRWAALTGVSWVPMVNPYMPTIALALPAAVADELAGFLRTEATIEEADDEAVIRFLRRAGVPMLVSVPNLVEHLEFPSLTDNTGQGVRRATCLAADGTSSFGEAVLDIPPLLPFQPWANGRAMTIDTTDPTFTARRPTLEVLTALGADPDALKAAGPAEPYEFDVWLTAVAMGVVQRCVWPDSLVELGARLASPLGVSALTSLAPGGLRRHVDFDTLLKRADELRARAEHGLRYGVAADQIRLKP